MNCSFSAVNIYHSQSAKLVIGIELQYDSNTHCEYTAPLVDKFVHIAIGVPIKNICNL